MPKRDFDHIPQTPAEQEKLPRLQAFASEAFQQINQGQGIELRGDQQLADFSTQIGRQVQRGR